MALSLCENCGSIEGGFREPDASQLEALRVLHGNDVTGEELEDLVCDQCGEAGGYTGISEHDDLEER